MAHRPATRAIASGRGAHTPGAPINPPIVLSSVFRAPAPVEYARDGNPTWTALEDVVGDLEGGRCVSFASGIAAVSAILSELPLGTHVVAPYDAYLGTRALLDDLAIRGRLTWVGVDVADADAVEAALNGANLLWLESPTNPLLAIADLRRLCAAASDWGVRSVVDSTFATPLLQRPLELGADIVVHSMTKLLAGHSDVLLGAAVARDDWIVERLLARRRLDGAIPGPVEAFLALRGVRSLPARIRVAQENAGELARRLVAHPAVERVRYPGLAEDPGHQLAAAQMDGFGTMLGVEVAGGGPAADAVCSAVRLVVFVTSLGGIDTTIERRARQPGEDHVPPGLLRLSVGCEDVEDLWDDLDQALRAARVS